MIIRLDFTIGSGLCNCREASPFSISCYAWGLDASMLFHSLWRILNCLDKAPEWKQPKEFFLVAAWILFLQSLDARELRRKMLLPCSSTPENSIYGLSFYRVYLSFLELISNFRCRQSILNPTSVPQLDFPSLVLRWMPPPSACVKVRAVVNPIPIPWVLKLVYDGLLNIEKRF